MYAHGERTESLTAVFEYSSDLFQANTIARFADSLLRLLASVCANVDERVDRLALLTDREAWLLTGDWNKRLAPVAALKPWNDTSQSWPDQAPVHQLIAARARRQAQAPALIFGDKVVTYEMLMVSVQQLATRLQRHGVGPEMVVAIAAYREPATVIAMLAVLMSGAAYLPLDPDYPQDRLQFMADDARASLLLVNHGRDLDLGLKTMAIRVETEHEAAVDFSQAFMAGSQLAYLIYTSGTTGKPKAVAISHAALLNHNRAVIAAYDLEPRDRVLHFASPSFDISVEEIFPTLVAGAGLVFPPERTPPTPADFWTLVTTAELSVVNLPTAYWQYLTEELNSTARAIPACLRLLIVGSEQANAASLNQWRKLANGRPRWINAYGPTEATVTATIYDDSSRGVHVADHLAPIGKPLANCRTYLLDDNLTPVPIGVVGRLFIGGAGIARGYLNRRGLTAERFVPDPFCTEPMGGGRMYDTGDMARFLEDGQLVFLGRGDDQIKIRGFRIELSEIEAALVDHEHVAACAAAYRNRARGEPLLTAYVVAVAGAEPAQRALRTFLEGRLPHYMVPSHFMILPKLPLSPNGKVDRAALPDPEPAGADQAPGQITSAMEALLAGVWRALLGVQHVGPADHFFQLGGHSLLATRLVSRLSRSLGRAVPVRLVFEQPTLAEMACALERLPAPPGRENQQTDLSVTATTVDKARPGHAPLSSAQTRFWFLQQLEPDLTVYNIPFALRLDGPLNPQTLKRSFKLLCLRHEILRTTFPMIDGQVRQVVGGQDDFLWSQHDFSDTAAPMERALKLAHASASDPFDLQQGPLLRVHLMDLGRQTHVLFLNLHHIITDEWSLNLLLNECGRLYDALALGAEPPPQAEQMTFAQYALWERQFLVDSQIGEALAYWRHHLRDLQALRLPHDRPRPAAATHRGNQETFVFETSLRDALVKLGADHQCTTYMVCLALYTLLLHRYTQQRDIAVGVPHAGRHHPDAETMVGCFVNTVVARTRWRGDPDFTTLLQLIRTDTLDAQTHGVLPFEKLVAELHPRRSGRLQPLFQVMFNFHHLSDELSFIQGLDCEALPFDPGGAAFDLTLTFELGDTRLQGAVEYDRDLFEPQTIKHMIEHLKVLARAVVDDPGKPLSRLALLTPEEHALLTTSENLILDQHLQPVPRGVAGRVYQRHVAHDQAAPGTLTPDPFAKEPGRWLLDTNRWGRLDLQGNLQALARDEMEPPEPPAPEKTDAPQESPRNDLERRIAKIWGSVLKLATPGIHDDFFDLGGHSLLALKLIDRLNELAEGSFSLSMLFQNRTVATLAQAIERGGHQQDALVTLKKEGTGVPLVLLHPAGGSVFPFTVLANHLTMPVFAFDGANPGVSPAETVEELAARYVDQLDAHFPDTAVQLAGWSSGGLLTFEMGRLLKRRGRPALGLTLIDCFHPAELRADLGEREPALAFLHDLLRLHGSLPNDFSSLSLPDDGNFDNLLQFVRERGLLPIQLKQDEVRIRALFHVFRTNAGAAAAYQPRVQNQECIMVRARDGDDAAGPELGWQRLPDQSKLWVTLPGDHYSILAEPLVGALAELLNNQNRGITPVSPKAHRAPSHKPPIKTN